MIPYWPRPARTASNSSGSSVAEQRAQLAGAGDHLELEHAVDLTAGLDRRRDAAQGQGAAEAESEEAGQRRRGQAARVRRVGQLQPVGTGVDHRAVIADLVDGVQRPHLDQQPGDKPLAVSGVGQPAGRDLDPEPRAELDHRLDIGDGPWPQYGVWFLMSIASGIARDGLSTGLVEQQLTGQLRHWFDAFACLCPRPTHRIETEHQTPKIALTGRLGFYRLKGR